MTKNRTSLGLRRITEIWKDAAIKGIMTNISDVTFNVNEYERTDEVLKRRIYTNIVLVDPDLLSNLTVSELKIATKIISDLKQNNALWHYELGEKTDRKYRAILSLKKKGVLFETNNSNIFLVNPWKIRKGQLETVIAATSNYIEKKGDLLPTHIKVLKAPKKVRINGFHNILS